MELVVPCWRAREYAVRLYLKGETSREWHLAMFSFLLSDYFTIVKWETIGKYRLKMFLNSVEQSMHSPSNCTSESESMRNDILLCSESLVAIVLSKYESKSRRSYFLLPSLKHWHDFQIFRAAWTRSFVVCWSLANRASMLVRSTFMAITHTFSQSLSRVAAAT